MPHSSGVKTHLLRATTSGRHIRNNPCAIVYSRVESRQAKGGSIPMVSDSDAGCFPKLGRIRKENGLGAKGRCDDVREMNPAGNKITNNTVKALRSLQFCYFSQ